MMLPVRFAVACVAAVVFAIKVKGSSKNRIIANEESAPGEPEKETAAPECVSTEPIENEGASQASPSETRTQSTVTANDASLEEPDDMEVSSKPGVVPGINIDAIAVGTDALEITPRKSSFSKLMKKVSSAIPSPRKQSAV
jgi:hypothetical protein